jgi:tetratricopeptide (TPR) repeat protein
MEEIFISYSSKHRSLTRQLEKAIEAQYGRDSVWWDNKRESWGSFEEQNRAKAEASSAIVVIWNEEAAASDWIKSEAHTAHKRGCLINVAVDGFPFDNIPKPYDTYHVKLLSDVPGILVSIAGVIAGKPPKTAIPAAGSAAGTRGTQLFDAGPEEPETHKPAEIPLPELIAQAREAAALPAEPGAGARGTPLFDAGPEEPETHKPAEIPLPELIAQALESAVPPADPGAGAWGTQFFDAGREESETRMPLEIPLPEPIAAALPAEPGADAQGTPLFDAGREEPETRVPLEIPLPEFTQALETAASSAEPGVGDQGTLRLDTGLAELETRTPLEILPSELLQARYAAVPFQDAAGAKDECLAWCQDAAPAAAGRLYHGPGGLGKTRLLIEVAAELRKSGWTAGFLNRDYLDGETRRKQAWQELEQWVLHGEDAGLLIVLDHAEARQPEAVEIAQLLLQAPANPARPLRLVLLARSAGWWERLREEHDEICRLFHRTPERPDAFALKPMANTAVWQNLFRETVNEFWPVLQLQGYAKPDRAVLRERLERATKGEGFERPLAIQMEALLWLCAVPAGANGIDAQLDAVLDLERARWQQLTGPLDSDARLGMERGAAQATAVAGTASEAATEALLMADLFYDGRRTVRADVAPVLRNLTSAYGRDTGGVSPIVPDLLGEHHVAVSADAEVIEGCLVWIETLAEAGREKRRRDLVGTLQRASRAEHGAAAGKAAVLLDRLILHHTPTLAADFVAVLTGMPGQLQSRIDAALDALDFDALRALDAALPPKHRQLLELAHGVSSRHAALSKAMLNQAQAEAAQPEGLEAAKALAAAAIGQHGFRSFTIGKREDAVEATREALEIYRDLAAARPEAFLPSVATALHDLAPMLSRAGHRDEALDAAREALAIRRQLAESQPDSPLGDVASSLDNLGDILSDLRQHGDALEAAEEAVAIYRRLAVVRRGAFQAGLAGSLNNLSRDLLNLGHHEQALEAAHEAVTLLRALAETRPVKFLPGLAVGLSNLATALTDLGHYGKAMDAAREAAAINQRLSEVQPDSFLAGFAACLNNLGNRIFDLGHREVALEMARETVALRRLLATSQPDAYRPGLASSLINYGARLTRLGFSEEALEATSEAVAIQRDLAEAQPGVFLPDLATGLNGLCNILAGVNKREAALRAVHEAIVIFRRLSKTRPDDFLPELARSLSSLSKILSKQDQYVEAAALQMEALEIIAPFAEKQPQAFLQFVQNLASNYREACQAGGVEADADLLERVRCAARTA